MNSLHAPGHSISLFTARESTTGINWRALTEQQLADWCVRYHTLMMGKPHADHFIDDKAIHLDDFY